MTEERLGDDAGQVQDLREALQAVAAERDALRQSRDTFVVALEAHKTRCKELEAEIKARDVVCPACHARALLSAPPKGPSMASDPMLSVANKEIAALKKRNAELTAEVQALLHWRYDLTGAEDRIKKLLVAGRALAERLASCLEVFSTELCCGDEAAEKALAHWRALAEQREGER